MLHNCVEVHEPIELLFVVVSGVGRGMGVLDRIQVAQGEGAVSGVFCCETAPLISVAYFRTEMYSTDT